MIETPTLLPDAKVILEIVDVICVELELDTDCQALAKELALVVVLNFEYEPICLSFSPVFVRPVSASPACAPVV